MVYLYTTWLKNGHGQKDLKVRQCIYPLIPLWCLSAKKLQFGRLHICKYYGKYWKRLGNANHALSVSLKCVKVKNYNHVQYGSHQNKSDKGDC